jgi:hypothetical protein
MGIIPIHPPRSGGRRGDAAVPRGAGRERSFAAGVETPRAVPPYGTPVTADAHESTDVTGAANMTEKNTFESILKWIVVVILAFAALKILLGVLGIAFFLGSVLLFRVLPIVLVVWLIVKAVEWLRSDRGTTPPTSTLDV